jgi:hypothetical protein
MVRTLLLAGLISGIVFPLGAIADEARMRAGAFKADITPRKFPVPMAGQMTPQFATQAHDPLSARCLVLDDGATRIAFCVIDAVAVTRQIMDDAKAQASKVTGIPTDRICMSATHTHTGVGVAYLFQSVPADTDYVQFMTRQIAEGIRQANDRLEPAQVGWGVAEEPRHVFNRRWILKEGVTYTNPFGSDGDRARMNPPRGDKGNDHPAGPTDPQVCVLAVRSADGSKPIALLANYSLHYVGGMPPNGLSADYFGAFASVMGRKLNAAELNPMFVAMMSNGTSGNINNVDFFHKVQPTYGPYEKIYVVADDVGAAAYGAWQGVAWHDHVPIRMAERAIDLAVRRPAAAEVTAAQELLVSAKKLENGAYREQPAIYANETIHMAEYPATVNAKLQAIRIGEVGITAIPCEVFVEIGLEIKARSPLKPTFTIELANGYNGYLATREQHKLGGYETWRARSAYLDVDSAEKIEGTVMELLGEVAK